MQQFMWQSRWQSVRRYLTQRDRPFQFSRRSLRRAVLLCLASLLGLALAIAPSVFAPAAAQVPLSTTSTAADPTRPPDSVERVGNLEWGMVRFEGKPLFAVTGLTVRDRRNPGDRVPVEDRIATIQSNLRWVLASNPTERGGAGMAWLFQTPTLDPNTLRVEADSLRDGTVLTVRDANSLPQPLLTVTPLDAQFHRRSVPQLVEEWQQILQQELTQALEIRQPAAIQRQTLIAQAIALMMVVSSFLLWLVQRWLKRRRDRLQARRKAARTAMRADVTYAAAATVNLKDDLPAPDPAAPTADADPLSTRYAPLDRQGDSRHSDDSAHPLIDNNSLERSPQPLSSSLPASPPYSPSWLDALRRLFTLDRRLSAVSFLQWLAFWGQILIWLGGIVLIVSRFPGTYTLTESIWLKPLSLLLIWFLVGLLNRLGDALINGLSNAWQENDLFTPEEAQRRSLRISTIVTAMKGLKTFLVYLMGLGWAFSVLGLPVGSVLTFGAVLAFAASLASQNLIRDLVNGFLIISEDQYAIGDVVTIGNSTGLVENMNLRVTQLRNGDGRLITIPNSMVDRVENQTRLWSRVDLIITVAYDSNIEHVLSVIHDVAQGLYDDPQWRDKFYNPPQVLGVETLSHEGISIRVWLDTQPMQQFAVGREFRLRVRIAFEENGIDIGMPQQLFRSPHAHEELPNHPFEDGEAHQDGTQGSAEPSSSPAPNAAEGRSPSPSAQRHS
ncbi:putative MscS family protein YkuT [Leptolyngbya sp. O-77]|nr:putative MscS family protein YkuT [Leptolyngbya sp. O-77]